MADAEHGGAALAQHEVGHPVHAALHGAGHRPKEVLDALAGAGFAVVPRGHIAPPQEYPKRVDCDDGIERIVHSREEEHQHKRPKGLASGKPISSGAGPAKP